MLDGRKGGVTRHLLSMNLRLCETLARASNVFVLNAERWFAASGSRSNPKAWYLGKIAFPRSVMVEAASDIRASIAGLTGCARKLLIVDLDDTLWGGIVGDVGWEGLRLGGHDGIGEAFVDFQRAIKQLKRRGVVLGIASKNEESVALEAMRKHPEMILREDDFVGWKINWNDKAKNIADLASELNLGLQSVVFIDDNPIERARVRDALPEVLVPEWPDDKLLYPSTFARLRCFDTPAISREDAERTRLYVEERKRDQLQTQVGSIEEWLKSLETWATQFASLTMSLAVG
jgi:FkbH-like protein